MADTRLLLGIDGGQTSTKSLLAAADGTILSAGKGPASDHFHIEGGIERNRRAIHGTTFDSLATAGAIADDVTAVALGLTGAPPAGDARKPVYEIIHEILRPQQITIHPDYITNLIGASSGGPGVVLVAGGGCIGYGVTGDGREGIAGGYGYLLGDEGSAFKIGIGAIRAAAMAGDKRAEPTTLTQIVCDHFQLGDIREIPQVVYRAGFERNRISLLTPMVAEAAESGDGAAARVLTEAGNAIGLVALGVIRQLFTPIEPVDVFMTGGVFNIGDRIIGPMNATIAAAWPTAVPREPRFPPAVGAIIVAARSLDIAVDDAFLGRIEATLPLVL